MEGAHEPEPEPEPTLVPPGAPTLTLTVNALTGHVATLEGVRPDATVASVLAEVGGDDPAAVRLEHRGLPLDDPLATLERYSIAEDAVLTLIPQSAEEGAERRAQAGQATLRAALSAEALARMRSVVEAHPESQPTRIEMLDADGKATRGEYWLSLSEKESTAYSFSLKSPQPPTWVAIVHWRPAASCATRCCGGKPTPDEQHEIAGYEDEVKNHPPTFTKLFRPNNPKRRRSPWPRQTFPLGFTVLTSQGEIVLKVKTPSGSASVGEKTHKKAPADLFTAKAAGPFKTIAEAHNRFGTGLQDSAVRSLAVAGCRTLEELLVVEALRDQLRPPGQDGASISDGCAVALAKAGCATLAGVRALGGAAVEAMPAAFSVEVARCLFGAKPADLGDETARAPLAPADGSRG